MKEISSLKQRNVSYMTIMKKNAFCLQEILDQSVHIQQDVIPSAEAVRNIFHICSQTVLCRNGYRGMSFVRHFIETKLDDQYLFTDRSRIQEVSRYYLSKVPERIRPQFAVCLAKHISNSVTTHWKNNALNFFKVLISDSSDDLALKISQKLQPTEAIDKTLYSVFVGLDQREHLWDPHSKSQAKAHLRDTLTTGRINSHVFESYGNLCTVTDLENEDKELIKERFSNISEHISRHTVFIGSKQKEILSLTIEAIQDDQYRQQVLENITCLIPSTLFIHESEEIGQFIDELIESDWREDSISDLFLRCSDWTDVLKVCLLKKSERFLEECSEDYPDDLLYLFVAAKGLISSNPTLLPSEFESAIRRIIEGEQDPVWFTEIGSTFLNFVGQIDLIRTQHGVHLPVLSSLTLPPTESEELEEDE